MMCFPKASTVSFLLDKHCIFNQVGIKEKKNQMKSFLKEPTDYWSYANGKLEGEEIIPALEHQRKIRDWE